MLRPLLNIESLLSSMREPSGPGRSSGCSGFPPFFEVEPQNFSCHFAEREEACLWEYSGFKQPGSFMRATLRDSLGSSPWVAPLGQRKSRFRNPASIVACPATVDNLLEDELKVVIPIRDRDRDSRGAACSKKNPGRGFGLKKQMLSDCNLRNLRRADDGTGLCKVGRMAATRSLVISESPGAAKSSVDNSFGGTSMLRDIFDDRRLGQSHDRAPKCTASTKGRRISGQKITALSLRSIVSNFYLPG
jgi:hypothetical protein